MRFDIRDSIGPGLQAELGPVLRGDPGQSAPLATQAEAEAGTLAEIRSWTPELIRQAIEALSTGGGSMLPPIGAHVRIQSSHRLLEYGGMTLLHSGHFEASAAWPDYPADILGGQVALRWANVNTGIGTDSAKIAMADSGTAIMVSYTGASISRDHGRTWQVLTLPGTGSLYGVRTDGKGTWIISGVSTRALLWSDDDGYTWTEVAHGITSGNIWDVVPDGNGTWMLSGTNNEPIRRSTDNGLTWTAVTAGNGGGLYAGATDGNGTWVFCGGGGRIYRTANNGDTWTSATPLGSTNACYTMAYGDGHFIVGNAAGTIYRSTDGVTWMIAAQISGANYAHIAHDANGHWLAASQGSSRALVRSDDGGQNWYVDAWPFGAATPYAYAVGWAQGSWLLAGGSGLVMRSEDNAWIGIAGHDPGLYLRVA